MTVSLDLSAAGSDSHARRTLSEISLSVAKSKKIVVITGAGISCSCGIPDFRSSDGLYAMVKEQYPDIVLKGRDLFDASLFRDATSTSIFYTFISQLKRSIDRASPAPTHHFIKTLDAKKKLLRSYTQNIDGLEARVGLLGSSCEDAKSDDKGKTKLRTKDVRNVQLHGDIHRVRCTACSAEYSCEEEHLVIFEKGIAPECPECMSRSEARMARSARAIRIGNLRPSIVLYDEAHPLGDDIGTIHNSDLRRRPDMLIIMGTSLKVHGLKKLVKDFARAVHSLDSPSSASSSKKPYKVIFINKTPPSSEWSDIIDYHIAGETDHWTNKVIEDWKKMRPSDWEIQQTLVENGRPTSMALGIKTVKKNASRTGKPNKNSKEMENIPIRPLDISKKLTVSVDKPVPLSPSKRRQKSSHYDDLESSPSKRQSKSVYRPNVTKEERKILFAESTNKQLVVKDASVCDSSMLDLGEMKTLARKSSVKKLHSKKVEETSRMDISIQDLSMRDISVDLTDKRNKAEPVKEVRAEIAPQRKVSIRRSTRERVVSKRLAVTT